MNEVGLQLFTSQVNEDIEAGTELADLILNHFDLKDGDVIVVTQKVVSKSEGQVVEVADGDQESFDTLVRSESRRILRRRGTLAITETHHGFI